MTHLQVTKFRALIFISVAINLLSADVCSPLNKFLNNLQVAIFAGSMKWCCINMTLPMYRIITKCHLVEHCVNNTIHYRIKIATALNILETCLMHKHTLVVQLDKLHEMQYCPI